MKKDNSKDVFKHTAEWCHHGKQRVNIPIGMWSGNLGMFAQKQIVQKGVKLAFCTAITIKNSSGQIDSYFWFIRITRV